MRPGDPAQRVGGGLERGGIAHRAALGGDGVEAAHLIGERLLVHHRAVARHPDVAAIADGERAGVIVRGRTDGRSAAAPAAAGQRRAGNAHQRGALSQGTGTDAGGARSPSHVSLLSGRTRAAISKRRAASRRGRNAVFRHCRRGWRLRNPKPWNRPPQCSGAATIQTPTTNET